jgi:hypothetical protein
MNEEVDFGELIKKKRSKSKSTVSQSSENAIPSEGNDLIRNDSILKRLNDLELKTSASSQDATVSDKNISSNSMKSGEYRPVYSRILDRMDEIEHKLDEVLAKSKTIGNKQPSIEEAKPSQVQDASDLSELDHIDSFSDEIPPVIVETSQGQLKKSSSQTVSFISTEPQLLEIPYNYFVDAKNEILNPDRSINWQNVLKIAQTFKWLVNIYTFTRYLMNIDEIYKKSNSKVPGIQTIDIPHSWIHFHDKESILKLFEINWTRNAIGKFGKTQTDLVDAFAHFQNFPKTSYELFSYLAQVYPKTYDITPEKPADYVGLRRIRNQLTLFVKENVVEKSTESTDKWFFRLK